MAEQRLIDANVAYEMGIEHHFTKEHLAWSIVGDERGIEYRIKCPICKLKVIGFGETVSVARERAVEAWNNMIEDWNTS